MSELRYPFLNLATVNEPYMPELERAAVETIRSGRYIGGEAVSKFEDTLASIAGTRYAVGVSNGLDALRLIFRALILTGRLSTGDVVLVPDNTYIASALAISDAGLTPRPVEVSARTLNMDTRLLEKAYTPEVKAVLTVHLYGRPCYDEYLAAFIESHHLLLVEDNAQAIGSYTMDGCPTGSLGIAAAFSFYPTKNIGALGDAGAVTTDAVDLALAVRALANYGAFERYCNVYKGFNCRLDAMQAAILNVKLRYFSAENERRRALAAVYNRNIDSKYVVKPLMSEPDNCVWHQYCILSEYRDQLRSYLKDNGVGTDINYPTPVHRQPCYKELSNYELPVAERVAAEVLCLPISSCTSEDDAVEISKIINSYDPGL